MSSHEGKPLLVEGTLELLAVGTDETEQFVQCTLSDEIELPRLGGGEVVGEGVGVYVCGEG